MFNQFGGFGGGGGGRDAFGRPMHGPGHAQQPQRSKENIYGADSPVQSLRQGRFPGHDAKHVWLVEFYAPCAPCACAREGRACGRASFLRRHFGVLLTCARCALRAGGATRALR
jgi:hypothetical protein